MCDIRQAPTHTHIYISIDLGPHKYYSPSAWRLAVNVGLARRCRGSQLQGYGRESLGFSGFERNYVISKGNRYITPAHSTTSPPNRSKLPNIIRNLNSVSIRDACHHQPDTPKLCKRPHKLSAHRTKLFNCCKINRTTRKTATKEAMHSGQKNCKPCVTLL